MAFSTRAREAAAAAAAMLTPKNFFGGGQDACAEPDIAPLSPAPIARMSIVHAEPEGKIMQQLRMREEQQKVYILLQLVPGTYSAAAGPFCMHGSAAAEYVRAAVQIAGQCHT